MSVQRLASGAFLLLVAGAIGWMSRYRVVEVPGRDIWILDRWTGSVCTPDLPGLFCIRLGSGEETYRGVNDAPPTVVGPPPLDSQGSADAVQADSVEREELLARIHARRRVLEEQGRIPRRDSTP